MPFNIGADVIFWSDTNPSKQWNITRIDLTPVEIGGSSRNAVTSALGILTGGGTVTGQSLVSHALDFQQGKLRFGGASVSLKDAGLVVDDRDDWIFYSKSNDEKLYYFNLNGTAVQSTTVLTIAHELQHYTTFSLDPLALASKTDFVARDSLMNGSNFDYKGPAVGAQNSVASELGQLDKVQAAYGGAYLISANPGLTSGYSYTDNMIVDIVRIGQDVDNNQDHTARTDNSRDLFFGLGGNDTLHGGGGNDYLYGGEGSDTLYGDDGDDFIFADGDYFHQTVAGDDVVYGNAGSDTIIAGYGNDQIYGGIGADKIRIDDVSGIIDPGPGADKIYLSKIELNPYYYSTAVLNADVSDSLFWNGYRLTGGVISLIDIEGSQGEYFRQYGYLKTGSSADGVAYILVNTADGVELNIYTPDGRATVITGWQQGLMGINLTGGDQFNPPSTVNQSNLCFDGKYFGFDESVEDLTGATRVLGSVGPNTAPTFPAPAQASVQFESFDSGHDHSTYLVAVNWIANNTGHELGNIHACLA